MQQNTNYMKNLKRNFFSLICCVAMASPMVTSCYDDSKLWEEIYMINSTLSEMKNSLNGQIEALDELIKGGNITISECKRKSDGTYAITLSNGTQFNVLHTDKSMKGVVSYIEVSGEKCWAAYNDTGKLELLKNNDGEYIPVQSAVPYVEERDGYYYLIVGDQEYPTGFDFDAHSVITGFKLNNDESGNTHSVTFTFGSDELTFTVPVDGYKGFTFRLSEKIISDLYVDYGSTYQISAGLDGVVDYVMQIPDGWRVKEKMDASTGELYLDVTAPAKTVVEAGAAEAEGQLKVVAVIEGGDAMVARLQLTTVPFRTLMTTTVNAIVEPYNGVDKYLYGLSLVSDFNQTTVFETAEDVLEENDPSKVETKGINVPMTELLGTEIEPGAEYVLWAVPAFYDKDSEGGLFYVKEGVIDTYVFGGSVVTLETSEVRFNDAFISFKLEGAASYFAGTAVKSDDLVEEILYQINNELKDPVSGQTEYVGSALDFPTADSNRDVNPVSGETYVTWVVPYLESKTAYTADDIISIEYTLSNVSDGGNVKVAFGEATIDRTSIKVPMTTDGGTRIYYTFLTTLKANSIKGQESAYLLNYGTVIEAGSGDAYIDMVNPDSKRVLCAMTTDEYGKFGPVTINTDAPYQTQKLYYNGLQVTATPIIADVKQTTAKVTVDVAGGEALDYAYWVGRETDDFWIRMEKKTSNIERHIALYPEEFEKFKFSHPLENGVLNLSDLRGETKYHVVVLAKDGTKDDNGYELYSRAGICQLETLAADLGDIVREGTTEWENARAQVDIRWNESTFTLPENSNMSAFYSFDIKCPKNLTAFILCATEGYFEENPETQTVEHCMIDIETQCSRKYDAGRTVYDKNGESLQEPDWVDDSGTTHKGTMMNVYNFYVHGYPTNGFATYFAESVHGNEGACSSWTAAGCGNYAYAEEHINRRHSIDYYKEYVKTNRGSSCKSQETIDRVAQDLYEAYLPLYRDAKPLIYINEGEYLHMEQHYGSGLDKDGNVVDDVFVVFKDAQGNYYEPMKFDVPNFFK